MKNSGSMQLSLKQKQIWQYNTYRLLLNKCCHSRDSRSRLPQQLH